MYSSVKFFVPSTIVGLLDALSAFCAPAPPASVSPIRSATPNETANAALAARRVCFRTISPSSSVCCVDPAVFGTLCPRSHPAVGRALRVREHRGCEQREGGDADRCCEYAGEPVGRLVGNDLSEAPAAGDAGDRGGGDHEHRGDPQA